jgi:ubiquinone/menaquinone biosynthesis C-methylase UbiE
LNDNNLTWEQAVQWLKSQPDRQDLVKDCYYDDPIEDAAQRFIESEEWAAIKKIAVSRFPCKVLDIGAGRGISSFGFAKSNCTVTALEPDSSAVVGTGAIRSLFDNSGMSIKIEEKFGEELPFPDCSFDIVYGRAVLHHAKDLKAFCREAYRVLKAGGMLLLTREHVLSRKKDLPVFFNTHALHRLYGGENAFLLREYLNAIKSAGFTIKKKYGPFQSPINYAPQSKAKFEAMLLSIVRKKTGVSCNRKSIAGMLLVKMLVTLSPLYYNSPGRLYSFYAVK